MPPIVSFIGLAQFRKNNARQPGGRSLAEGGGYNGLGHQIPARKTGLAREEADTGHGVNYRGGQE